MKITIMVVCHNASWKIPIAYFLIKSISGTEKTNLINESLIRLHEIDVEITVTCDGPSGHFPGNKERKVYAIFYAYHIRNCLGHLGILIDQSGEQIKWEYITKLFNLQ